MLLALQKMREMTDDPAFVEFKSPIVEEYYDYFTSKKKERKTKPWLKYKENIKFRGRGKTKKKILKKHHLQYLFEFMESCKKDYLTLE